MNIHIPQLTPEQNTELNNLVDNVANGGFWEEQGWTTEHAERLPRAKIKLEKFLASLLPTSSQNPTTIC